MKKKDIFLLIILIGISAMFLCFSAEMRQGAYNGIVLAQNTIIPSLLPLLIIFLMIIKTGARDVFAKAFGLLSIYIFNLPVSTMPVIILGQIGGYPTGALLTGELYQNGDIDEEQAAHTLSFSVCGGAGFIITAVGSATLSSVKAGVILLLSNIISNILLGVALSFTRPRIRREYYSFSPSNDISTALIEATESAMKSVLDMTAFIVLFGAISSIINPPDFLIPILEITQGICTGKSFSLPEISAYLAFGGICIHLQLLPTILKCKMKYTKFLLARFITAMLSYCITKLILLMFPIEVNVFSSTSKTLPALSSVNLGLSALLIIGCFVLVLDVNSKKRIID